MMILWGSPKVDQAMLPGFGDPLPDMSKKTLGTLGELTAWRALESAGYTVLKGERRGGDLRAVDSDGVVWRVEVKTARRSRIGWCWSLRRVLPDRVATNWQDADVLVLLAVESDGSVIPFVCPVTAVVTGYVTMRNPQQPRGKWQQYAVAGDVLRLPVEESTQ